MSHVGEVIASSTMRFTAQCPDEDRAPEYGGFVMVDTPDGRAVAVVSEVRAGSVEGNRRPLAYGLSEEDLYRQQPQLRELLSTEFDAWLVGYDDGLRWRPILPPRPPRLHRFVHPAQPADILAITADGQYLRTLSAAGLSDDFLAAAVRASLAVRGDDRAYLVATGQQLARLLGDDYDRLKAMLRRVAP